MHPHWSIFSSFPPSSTLRPFRPFSFQVLTFLSSDCFSPTCRTKDFPFPAYLALVVLDPSALDPPENPEVPKVYEILEPSISLVDTYLTTNQPVSNSCVAE